MANSNLSFNHKLFKTMILCIILSFLVMIFFFIKVALSPKELEFPQNIGNYLTFAEQRFTADQSNTFQVCDTEYFITSNVRQAVPCLITSPIPSLSSTAMIKVVSGDYSQLSSHMYGRILYPTTDLEVNVVSFHLIRQLHPKLIDKAALIFKSDIDLFDATDMRGVNVKRLTTKVTKGTNVFVPANFFVQTKGSFEEFHILSRVDTKLLIEAIIEN